MQKLSLIFTTTSLFLAQNIYAQAEFNKCIEQLVASAPDKLTLGEMRKQCAPQSQAESETETQKGQGENREARLVLVSDPVARRIAADKRNLHKPFTLMAHGPNYLLPVSYNASSWDSSLYKNTNGQQQLDLDKTEVQFQLSIKMPLATDIFGSEIDAYGGYTMRSFWQAYNSSDSAPFRETNHQPEVWLQRRCDLSLGPLKNVLNSIGIVHHSNGQGGELSRSWNRLYASFGFAIGDLAFMIKPWLRFEEEPEEDNNPDIDDYLGHAEIVFAYEYANHTFSLLSRNNLESGFSKGAVQLGWSFPFLNYDYLRGYVQYFHGYGESLIDYDHSIDRIGVGLLLTNYL